MLAFATSLVACGGSDNADDDDNRGPGDSDNDNTGDNDGGDGGTNKGTPHAPPPGINEPERVHSTGGTSWTFLVYMVADNDLEPFALQDLEEMMVGGSRPNFNIVVQVDRAVGFSDAPVAGLSFTSTKRLLVNDGGLTELDDLGEQNHGVSQQLSDFIAWGVQTYPADKVAVILWDHGSAWPGFGADFSDGYDALTMPEMALGLEVALSTLGRTSFNLLGFDACLMGALETGLALRPYAEYLLASEELEPGHGWDYRVLENLIGTSTAVEMAGALIDGFAAQAQAQNTDDAITLSLVDMYNLKAIERALHAMDNALVDNNSVTPAVVRARDAALEFGRDPSGSASAHMLDLGNIATAISRTVPSLATGANQLTAAIDAAVLDQTTGRTTARATGIAVYWPPFRRAYNPDYENLPGVTAWRDFLETAQSDEHTGGDVVPRFTNAPVQVQVASSGGAYLYGAQLEAGTEINVVETGLYYGVAQGDNIFVLGDSFGVLDTERFVIGAWDGYVLTITQGAQSVYGYLSFQEAGDGTTLAAIPLYYQRPGQSTVNSAIYVVTYDTNNVPQQQTLYHYSEAGYAELTPEVGSALYAAQGLLTDSGIEFIVVDSVAFDPTASLSIGYDLVLGSAEWESFILLYATGATGDGDAVSSLERDWPQL